MDTTTLTPVRSAPMPDKRRPAAKPRRKRRGTAYLVSAAKVVARREAVGTARGRALTQEEAATLAGLHRPNYARMEQGDTNPTVDVAVRVARALGCLVEDLIIGAE
jgi:DNA-binding XRE family transcriptional regulator